jgi:tetratricopeptide (TPR) repeat protein
MKSTFDQTWCRRIGIVGMLLGTLSVVGCQSGSRLVWRKDNEAPPVLPAANKDKPEVPLKIVEGKKEKPTPKMLVDFGYVQASMNNHGEAMSLFERALKLDKKNEAAYVGLAKVKMQMGHPDQAIELLGGALKKCPKSAAIHNEIGIAHAKMSQNDQAIQSLEKAVELDPDSDLYRQNLAGILVVQGETEKAYKYYSRMMSAADAHVRIGEILGGQGRLSEGKEHLRAAIEAEPNHERAIALMAQMNKPELQQVDYRSPR